MRVAEEQGLELVEVNPRAAPPVCKIMDFGKFKYETSKKEKASRRHQSTIVLKEIKLRPKTDDHDLDFKVKHIRRFLAEGNKCKLVIVFRGREIVHPETGQAMLDAVIKAVGECTVEQRAMMEGRRMVMVIGPRVGVIRPAGAPGAPVGAATGSPSPVASTPGAASASPAAPPSPATPAESVPAASGPAAPAPVHPRPVTRNLETETTGRSLRHGAAGPLAGAAMGRRGVAAPARLATGEAGWARGRVAPRTTAKPVLARSPQMAILRPSHAQN